MPTELKTILAGATGEAFSARVVALIAVFNSSMTPSCRLGCWDSGFMVETQSGGERTARREGCEEDP